MTTYKDSGVDINAGDESSKIAYEAAKETFISRKGMIGEPVIIEGGFSGAMDFGDFYLVQNDDGIGTKVAVAGLVGKYDTLGYDLVAMVADDAVCVGAEVVSVSNTIDVAKVEKNVIKDMMKGLKSACREQKIVVPGGEIAELGTMVNGYIWNATAVGIVEKNKFIMGDRVMAGDKIIGLKSNVFRSNGLTLVRHILNDRYGENWHREPFNDKETWGRIILEPTIIYHNAVLELIGRYKEQPKVDVKALAHITGGGLPGNISRIVRHNNLGARLDNLPEPHEAVLRVIKMGNVSEEEAYKTWNMGVGMAIVCNEFEEVEGICKKHGIEAYEIGEIVSERGIQIDKFKF
jgi:phosphoribosylformylglycinamidine cyclo-ligase